jgi:hypothetical protein
MGGDAMSGGAWSRDCVARIEALESETERLLRRVADLAAKWEEDAARFAIVARDSTIPQARDAALRLMQSRTEHAADLRALLAPVKESR